MTGKTPEIGHNQPAKDEKGIDKSLYINYDACSLQLGRRTITSEATISPDAFSHYGLVVPRILWIPATPKSGATRLFSGSSQLFYQGTPMTATQAVSRGFLLARASTSGILCRYLFV